MRDMTKKSFFGGVVALIVVVLIVVLGWDLLRIKMPTVNTAMEKVSVMDTFRPTVSDPEAIAQRLDSETGEPWGLHIYGGKGATAGVPPIGDLPAELSDQFATAPVEPSLLQSVMTNIGNAESIERNGVLLMQWVFFPGDNEAWLQTDPVVFTDPELEALRDTYWTGGWVTFYAPVGEIDRTDLIRGFLMQVATCPHHSDACTPGSQIAGFSSWADRAVDKH